MIYHTALAGIMQLVHVVSETDTSSGELFNGAHVASSLNRKMIAPVNNKGIAQLFHYKVELQSAAAQTLTLKTASNSYVTKQAIRAWYRIWRKMLRDAGVSLKDLGPYGKVFKPRLLGTDGDGDGTIENESLFGNAAELGRGEWNYTDVITQPAAKQDANRDMQSEDVADQYGLHLCGPSVVQTDSTVHKWTTVGMINSWLDSRKKPVGPDADDVPASQIWGDDNPLLHARMGGSPGELMSDEVRDLQADEAPYTESDLDGLYTQAILKSNGTDTAVAMISAPCGLIDVTLSAATATDVIFTLQGITDM